MQEKIFNSQFKLNFVKKDIENDYKIESEKNLLNYNKIIMIILFLFSIADSIINSFFLEFYPNSMYRVCLFSSYILTGILIILLFICFFSKNIKLLKWIHFFNYYFLFILFVDFRYSILRLVPNNQVYFDVFIWIEMLIRLIWVVIGMIGFMESFVLNLLSIASMWIVYAPAFTKEIFFIVSINTFSYCLSILSVIIFSYVLVRKDKKSFYFEWTLKKKANWLNNILENIEAGYLFISENKVKYVNSFLENKIFKNNDKNNQEGTNLKTSEQEKDLSKTIKENEERKKNDNEIIHDESAKTNNLLTCIMENLSTKSLTDSNIKIKMNEFKEEFNNNKNNIGINLLKKFLKYISQINEINNFKLIGDKIIDTEYGQLSYEVYCRYNKSDSGEDDLHFLLNDVTRTKMKEKSIAEYKYKTLFLSKVAHEIRNPLVSISELISQIEHNLSKIEDETITTDFNHIKSICEYLLVLIKDLNYFAEAQIGNDDFIVKEVTNLNEVVEFCKLITNSLIKKTNKTDKINFNTIIHDDVPKEFITDPMRIKQILINLLSNSIKYTYFGEIKLEVSLERRIENNMIKFLISDTGIGIKEEHKKKLFFPFFKGFEDADHLMGSGLGLPIANEIAERLGEKISFTSEFGKGSSFWFYININKEKLPNKRHLIKTEEIIYNSIPKIEEINITPINEYLDTKKKEFILNITNFRNKFDLCINNNEEENDHLINIRNVERNKSNQICLKIKDENNIKLVSPEIKLIPKKLITNNYSNEIKSPLKNIVNHSDIKFNEENKFEFNIADYFLNDISNLRNKDKTINVIVVDDETMTRKSTIRIIHNVSEKMGIKINIIEAEDGMECIYLIYKSFTQGILISSIFSDENMNFMNGSKSSQIIKDIIKRKNLKEIPFYLITAYDYKLIENYVGPFIKKILSKPLSQEKAKAIINEILNN